MRWNHLGLSCQPPTLARLEELISEARRSGRPFHVVHFDGHGDHDPHGEGLGELDFELADRNLDRVDGLRLGDLLARLEISLVLLEACRSSGFSTAPISTSLAPALLRSGVSSVVAFSHRVNIEASRSLVRRFYLELAAGRTVGEAISESRSALRASPVRWPPPKSGILESWFIPQLYQVGRDSALVSATPRGGG